MGSHLPHTSDPIAHISLATMDHHIILVVSVQNSELMGMCRLYNVDEKAMEKPEN